MISPWCPNSSSSSGRRSQTHDLVAEADAEGRHAAAMISRVASIA